MLFLLSALFVTAVPASAAAKKKTVTISLDAKNQSKSLVYLMAEKSTEYIISIKVLSVTGKGSGTGYWIPATSDTSKGSLFYGFDYSKIRKNAVFNVHDVDTTGVLTFSMPQGIKKLKLRVTFTAGKKLIKSVAVYKSSDEAFGKFDQYCFKMTDPKELNLHKIVWYWPGNNSYNIHTAAARYYSEKMVILSNSNEDVVDARITGSSVEYTVKKTGKAKLALQLLVGGKKHKVTLTIEARKFKLPIKSVTIGKTDLTSLFAKEWWVHDRSRESLSGKLKITLNPGWKLSRLEYSYFPEGTSVTTPVELTNGQKVKIQKGGTLSFAVEKTDSKESVPGDETKYMTFWYELPNH